MNLSVIGAGFGRTGTLSMKLALETLGLGPCHHMADVLSNPDQLAKWREVAQGGVQNWDDLLNEAIIVRKSTISLFNSFTTEMLAKLGMGFKGEYSVHAIGFILVGHQRWHFRVINEKYIPLI